VRSFDYSWRGCIVRARPSGEPQIVASNVSRGFIVTSPEPREFSPRRVTRYLLALHAGEIEPIVLLNKSDLLDAASLESHLGELRSIAGDAVVLPVSARSGAGCDALHAFLQPGATVALCGSSGVGKSTLVNRLAGEQIMPTGEMRSDGRGRHTTTVRRVIALPNGASIVDTPGMRAFLPFAKSDDVDAVFDDVAAAATQCRFADCAHADEPGCAVRETVDADRLAQWHKIGRETEWLASREDVFLANERKRKWKAIHKAARRAAR
jgi:ribosome biogenesis GTPase